MFIPDYNKNGAMSEIKKIHNYTFDLDGKTYNKHPTELYWKENEDCGGFTIDWTKCSLRYDEMELIAYQPKECASGKYANCKELVAYVRYNIKN